MTGGVDRRRWQRKRGRWERGRKIRGRGFIDYLFPFPPFFLFNVKHRNAEERGRRGHITEAHNDQPATLFKIGETWEPKTSKPQNPTNAPMACDSGRDSTQ